MTDLSENWRIVTALLRDALDCERARLGEGDAAHVEEYLDANELGLAHDHIIDALGDRDLAPLPRAAELLAEAGRRMGHTRHGSGTSPADAT